ncbi:3-isopropylmalate dehydrogenase [Rothia sp. CCM 9418]|uniref:3-isopropylmalate dehydrogenase n=1 Tax=Rothia sp. CCM 9418 TaxID=3402661 RepID=UPI003AE6C1BD
MTEQRTLNLAIIPGDGIGPEIVAQAERVLDAVATRDGFTLTKTTYSLGAEHWLVTGETLTDETLTQLGGHDAILFGAVGADPRSAQVPSGLIEREILLKLRFSFDHFINLRPSRLFAGVSSPLADPGDIDFVVVREGTEGPYVGNGGVIRAGTDAEIATEVSVNTAYGVQRLMRYAFELAAQRERKKLTLVHKNNVLVHAGGLYTRTLEQLSAEYPQVSVDYCHVDAATIFLTTDPSRFDVIVTDNLFGDILTDQAGAITGGIGYAACGNINASGQYPSMFEPVHGSAPDIAGQNVANPTATILAAAMLLRHIGLEDSAARIERAVEHDLAEHAGQSRNTDVIGADIVTALEKI